MPFPDNLFPAQLNPLNQSHPRPSVRIVEQPSKSLRYRYIVEGRPGTIAGISSTHENKTPFTIEILGYTGRVAVVVSCVTQSHPYKAHPHSLSGPHCKDGYYTIRTEVSPQNPRISFPKLAIQCVKRNAVQESLRMRQKKNIDPFKTGFDHCNDVKSIDLNVLRLCVQVFLKGEGKDIVGVLTPVVSEPIHNKKTVPDPIIHRLSSCNCCVNGNINGKDEEIFLLCTKVSKDDIKIRFYEVRDGQTIWQEYGKFKSNGVYNHTAICFKPPKYFNQNITEPVKVFVQLVRPSDDFVSSPVDFEYLPLETEPGALAAKRLENSGNPFFVELMQMTGSGQTPEPQPQTTNSFTAINYIQDSFTMGSNSNLLSLTPSPLNVSPRRESQDCFSNLPHFQNLGPFSNSPSTSREPTPSSGTSSCDGSMSAWNYEYFLNSITQNPATSMETTSWTDGSIPQNVYNYSTINSDDFTGVNADDIASANVVREMIPNILENSLPVISVNSEDLEMRSLERLSETFQDFQVS